MKASRPPPVQGVDMPFDKTRTQTKGFVQAAEDLLAAVQAAPDAPNGDAGHEPNHEAEVVVDVHAHEETGNGPDDALGLYLKQMGAIPLLNRTEELVLAEKLERAR